MNNILNGKFISALTPDANTTNNLSEYYNEFKEEVVKLRSSNFSYCELYVLLMELLGILTFTINNSESKQIGFFATRAQSLIKAELKFIELGDRSSSPSIKVKKSSTQPDFHWALTPTELSELLVALNSSGAFKYENQQTASFSSIVNFAEKTFNIKLGDPRDVKRNIISRKTKKSPFLDKLASELQKTSKN